MMTKEYTDVEMKCRSNSCENKFIMRVRISDNPVIPEVCNECESKFYNDCLKNETILSQEYQDTLRELSNMSSKLNDVVTQAKIVSNSLDAIKIEDEQALLLIKIGKMMDKHAADMEKI